MLKPRESALYPQTKMSAILGKLWVIPEQDFHSEYNDLQERTSLWSQFTLWII